MKLAKLPDGRTLKFAADDPDEVMDSAITGTVDANVVQVTGVTVTGTGTESDPWGP